MSESAPIQKTSTHDKVLFWGCFIALVTTAFGFISRMFLIGEWQTEFSLDKAQAGRLAGIGIWPFAVSIIGFSLFIDKIGYKMAMVIAFLGHIIWAIMGVAAFYVSRDGNPELGFQLIYWGSLILALGNGTVEAFINPVVATMFNKEKTKWLNILHAGWPGGLVIAGIIVIYMGNADWGLKVGIIAAPAVLYFLILIGLKFPVQERVASGVSYREMLSEFGILGAMIVGFLVTLQLIDFAGPDASDALKYAFIGIGALIVFGFGAYTRAMGRPLLFILVLIMMPLATTEIGTDGWITGIMENVFEQSPEEVGEAGGPENSIELGGKFYSMHPGWVLVYTSVIMMVLRFFAGPIVHAFSPLGLLAISAVLAIAGLFTLSFTAGMMIFLAATLYAFGKTFFWPTMLGVVSEQTPKGGALTLNAISGIGMLAVGTLGFPYIGTLQADKRIEALNESKETAAKLPHLVKNDSLTVIEEKEIYSIIKYKTVNDAQYGELTTGKTLFPEQNDAYTTAASDKKFDLNKDGKIEGKEKTMKDGWAKKQADAVVKKWDTNRDGKLDADELAKKKKSEETAAKEAADAWARRWDKNGNWKDSGEKLEDSESNQMKTDEADRKAAWIRQFDKDKDGSLSNSEYAEAGKLAAELDGVGNKSNQKALASMTIFPVVMLIGYILLIFYFKARGGYEADELTASGGEGKAVK